MSETKHTPGPWVAHRNSEYWEIRPSDVLASHAIGGPLCIGDVCASDPLHADSGLQEANARLISAAPELLDALRVALVHVDARQSECDSRLWVGMLKDIDLIRSAIAKAEGR